MPAEIQILYPFGWSLEESQVNFSQLRSPLEFSIALRLELSRCRWENGSPGSFSPGDRAISQVAKLIRRTTRILAASQLGEWQKNKWETAICCWCPDIPIFWTEVVKICDDQTLLPKYPILGLHKSLSPCSIQISPLIFENNGLLGINPWGLKGSP